VLVLARLFEAGGLSTIVVSMMPSWAERYGAPRVAAVEFPFGHPLGLPDDEEMQTMVVRDGLRVLAEADGPNTIVDLDHVWPGKESEWRRRWQPPSASPLIARHMDEIRSMRSRS